MLIGRVLIVIILYILQGFVQGFRGSIPLYLASYKASWQQQGTFSWVSYPFSFKILWAPIIDSIYNHKFGRHLTWLIPIQILIGIILIILSFYLEYLLINLEIYKLTIIFLFIYFLISSQDIVVDGWSISLFASTNLQWSSTCQIIGQVIGYSFGSTILMTFESANFTNKYIRQTFSQPQQSYGLFSLQQYTFFWGVLFIIISFILLLMFFNKNPLENKNNKQKRLNLFETYTAIWELFKKQCMREFALILFTFGIGFAASNYMTILILLEYGITRDTLALLSIPLIAVNILVPLYMSNKSHPLLWFARSYIPHLIGCLIVAIYIFFVPQNLHKPYFYPILILLLCLNEILIFIMVASRIGFCARISEPRIAGTYMTLLATISNLGFSLSSTLVFYTANWLPKQYAYYIEVGVCFVLGLIWIGLFWRVIKRLDRLPIEEWYIKSSDDTHIIIDQKSTVKSC